MSYNEFIAETKLIRATDINPDNPPNLGIKIDILFDPDPVNPRKEFDHVATMVCWHRRDNLGDEQPGCEPEEYLTGLMSSETQTRLERIQNALDEMSYRFDRAKRNVQYAKSPLFTEEETAQLQAIDKALGDCRAYLTEGEFKAYSNLKTALLHQAMGLLDPSVFAEILSFDPITVAAIWTGVPEMMKARIEQIEKEARHRFASDFGHDFALSLTNGTGTVLRQWEQAIRHAAYCRYTGQFSNRMAFLTEERDRVREKGLEPYVFRELYLDDHGGLSISAGKFSCPWDSGQLGFIYVSKADAIEKYGISSYEPSFIRLIEKRLDDEVSEYDDYLTGQCFGFRLTEIHIDEDGDEVEQGELDSCWGFLGDDKYAMEEAESQIEFYMEQIVRKYLAEHGPAHRQLELAI